ncbi:MAG: hypothetical protein A2X94_14120 [Bdellovibrionales bacterium GWB1_55_8]|nr:MAG: hypothetical protein A2X94_14120 [Bdellovibrionales bacterium GWB1_55_8]
MKTSRPPARVKITLRQWPGQLRDILKDTGRQMHEANLLIVAGSLAYTTILSIVPLLAVSFAIFQAFGGLEKLYATVTPFVLENLSEGISDEAIVALRRFIDNAQANVIGAGGLIALIITTILMLSSAENAINQVWHTKVSRSWFQRFSAYWLFVTLGPVALAVVVGAATSTDVPLVSLLPSGTGIFAITIGLFYLVYKYVPHRPVRWQYALAAAIVAAIFWNLARIGYALYTTEVITYNKIYGSLGAVPILLLWIYIVWVIVLGGAAFSAALQKRFDGLTAITNGDKPGVRA